MAPKRLLLLVVTALAMAAAVAVLVALGVELRIIGGGILALAGGIGVVWGAVKASVEAPQTIRSFLAKDEYSSYAWTPILGIEFWQDGQRVPMQAWTEARAQATATLIRLRPKPFSIRISNLRSARALQVAVSRDGRLFNGAGTRDFDPMCLWPGTGAASTQAGDGAFVLCGPWRDERIHPPHNYFDKGGRLRREGDAFEVYLSRPEDRPAAGFTKGERYFAIAGLDSDRDGRISRQERELLVLDFR